LFADTAEPLQFLTIDRWRTAEDFESFKRLFGKQYEEMDRQFDGFTETETLIGTLTTD
jgi:hypothetical protein